MTSFGKLFKVMGRDKFRVVNLIMVVELLAVAVSLVWTLIMGHMTSMNFFGSVSGWSGMAYLAGFILIAREAEQAFTRDTYRLIPAKDSSFYLANLASSFVLFFYLVLLQAALHLIGIVVAWKPVSQGLNGVIVHSGSIDWGQVFQVGGMLTLLVLAAFVLALTTITLVHLTVSVTNNFLPVAGKRLIDFILYIVVIVLVIRVGGYLLGQVNQLTTTFNTQGLGNIGIPLLGIVLLIVLESLLNVFMMKRWVETVAN